MTLHNVGDEIDHMVVVSYSQAKRLAEEIEMAPKRQLVETDTVKSPFMSLLHDALASFTELRNLLKTDFLPVPTTGIELFTLLEPLLWKSSEVAVKLAIPAAIMQLNLLASTVQDCEDVSHSICLAKQALSRPIHRETNVELGLEFDRLQRLAVLADLYSEPLRTFRGTSQRFQHRGLLPALEAMKSVCDKIDADLNSLMNMLAAGSNGFGVTPIPNLNTLGRDGQLRFGCACCTDCVIFLPSAKDERICAFCVCPLRAHGRAAPIKVCDLLQGDDDE